VYEITPKRFVKKAKNVENKRITGERQTFKNKNKKGLDLALTAYLIVRHTRGETLLLGTD